MISTKTKLASLLTFVVLAAGFTLLLAFSFKRLSVFEAGVKESLLLGSVAGVDSEGNFMVGVDKHFQVYPLTVQSIRVLNTTVKLADGAEYGANFTYLFRLNSSSLPELYTAFRADWRLFFESFAVSEVTRSLSQLTEASLPSLGEFSDRLMFFSQFGEEFVGIFFNSFRPQKRAQS